MKLYCEKCGTVCDKHINKIEFVSDEEKRAALSLYMDLSDKRTVKYGDLSVAEKSVSEDFILYGLARRLTNTRTIETYWGTEKEIKISDQIQKISSTRYHSFLKFFS